MVGMERPKDWPHKVTMPPRPKSKIQAYAPMKGGDIMDSKVNTRRLWRPAKR